MMGSNLTSSKRKGEVRITGDDITISAPLIFLGAGTKIENNGIFYIK